MRTSIAATLALTLVAFGAVSSSGQTATPQLPKGAKVYIAPMPDGFDGFLKAALEKKHVPLEIVQDKAHAQFEMTGHSETQKASAAKKAFMLNWHSDEQASIQVASLESGEVVFAYSVNKKSSAHGKQSTAEACAKHLKEVLK